MNTLINRLLRTEPSCVPLPLRIALGAVFIGHGAQKLFGAFGGWGLESTAQWMASQGLEPGMVMAVLAGSAEFFGGILVLLGLITRPAAAVLAFTMGVAMASVHLPNGLFLANGGYEYALTLFMASIALAFSGGGRYSVDAWLQRFVARRPANR